MADQFQLNDDQMLKPTNKQGARHFVNATHYSAKGLAATWKNEFAFRTELRLLLIMLPAAFFLGQSVVERSILIIPLFLVLMAELTNTALETITDRISTESHPLSGQAKDIGSALVFTSLLATICIWSLFIHERISQYLA